MNLLERGGFIDTLCEYATAARGGESRLVLVAGEAGVGKTTLLEVLRDRLTDARWLWGACDGSFTPQPLGPLFDVAAQIGGALEQACRKDGSKQRLFRLILEELGSSTRLTVLAVDDVHWADEATLDLLRFLSRRLRETRTLLIATYRDDGLARDHPLRVAIGELSSHRSTRRVSLPPLSRDAVDALARGSGIEPAELYRLTGGNPFYVTEVLGVGAGVVPVSAREAVLARVARLSGDSRRVLEAAAVIGTRVELELLRRVAGANGDSIDGCLTAGALVSDADGFRFRHEIARLAVEAAIPAHTRTDLHRQTLDALVSSGHRDYARLAHHAEGAHDRAAVLQYATLAAQRAAELAAHLEAAAQYERALRYSDSLEPAARATLYDKLAAQGALIDRWEDVAEARQKALALWRQVGDQTRVGDTLRYLSRAMWRLCRGAEAEATAASAVEVLESLPPTSELAWAYANLAAFRMFHGDAEAVPLARKSAELADLLGDSSVLSDALNTEACYRINIGEDGEELLREALHVAMAAQSEEQAGRACANLHAVLAGEYRLAEAERCFAEAIAYCEEHDMATYGTCLRGERTHTLGKLGRWDEAESQCLDILQRQDLSPVNRLNPLITLARLRVRQGHPEAPSLLEEATTLADGNGEPGWIAMAGLSRVEAAWHAGHIQQAVEEARATVDPARRFDSWAQGSLAAWLRRLGVSDIDLPLIAEPYARELAGDWAGAAQKWLELGCPYDAGLALLDSDDESAMREAVRLFDRLGAAATVAVAQASMRRLGLKAIPRGPRSQTRADQFGLTRREREILAELCEGATNAEIAGRLFISEKTVDHHVSAVLAKLCVESRHAAALKAKQSGVVDAAAR